MVINQILLSLAAMALHAGFGLSLGELFRQSRLRGLPYTWVMLTASFFTLIYLPSIIVILGLNDLSGVIRGLIITLGVLTAFAPSLQLHLRVENLNPATLWRVYPAICMFLLAIWSLHAISYNGQPSAAPLVLASSMAAVAALRRRHNPA